MTSAFLQGRLLWCDAEANCWRLSTREGVADVAEKAQRANISTIIVDVKPLGGEVLYPSRYTPRLGEVKGFRYPEDFDLLGVMIEEGHSRGLKVHAAVNVFSEGHRLWNRGPGFERPEWQVTMYEAVRLLSFPGGSVAVNLVDPWTVPPGEPAIFTRKSGETLRAEPGRWYVAVNDECAVTEVLSGSEVSVPESGCVLSLPETANVAPGDSVVFRAEPVTRPAQESAIPSWGLFVNPIGPAREHELRIMEEIVSGYDVDGITLDRMRYPNLHADFGPESHEAFERRIGRTVNWPEDVYIINDLPWEQPVPGRYYREWLEWRAEQIHDFAQEATSLVRAVKPGVKVGAYVGSWYDSYFDVGVNWGSREHHGRCAWMTEEYNRTGIAEMFDYICTGCYYPHPTRADARARGKPEGMSVEAACEVSRRAIRDVACIYAGIYLLEYAGNPEGFRKAVQVAAENSHGVMLFDLVYLEDYGWWPIIEEGSAGTEKV